MNKNMRYRVMSLLLLSVNVMHAFIILNKTGQELKIAGLFKKPGTTKPQESVITRNSSGDLRNNECIIVIPEDREIKGSLGSLVGFTFANSFVKVTHELDHYTPSDLRSSMVFAINPDFSVDNITTLPTSTEVKVAKVTLTMPSDAQESLEDRVAALEKTMKEVKKDMADLK